jgi:hypothetical protein
MILITLAGDSIRFFNAGYSVVKYKLVLGNKSILESILGYIPRNEKVLLVLNSRFNDYEFAYQLLESMAFDLFRIVEIDKTSGQFESTILGLEEAEDFWSDSEPITIYNGDTIRKLNFWHFHDCDGYIEVFEAEGNHWSFVDNIGKVNQVVEKERISTYCSSGLYFFKYIKYITEFGNEYINSSLGESYIAPFYNILINKGLNITSGNVAKTNFIFCGTPSEYAEACKLIL